MHSRGVGLFILFHYLQCMYFCTVPVLFNLSRNGRVHYIIHPHANGSIMHPWFFCLLAASFSGFLGSVSVSASVFPVFLCPGRLSSSSTAAY